MNDKELLQQPAMPICAAYGVKSKYDFDPANGHKQLIGLSIGRPGTVFDDQIVELFTADALADVWRESQKAEAAHLAKCDSYYARGDFGNHPQRVVNPYAPTNPIAPAAAIAQPALEPAPGYCKNCKDYTIAEPLFALPVQRAPAGMCLVPIEPTQSMCIAGQDKAAEWPRFPLRINPIYRAMIAAHNSAA